MQASSKRIDDVVFGLRNVEKGHLRLLMGRSIVRMWLLRERDLLVSLTLVAVIAAGVAVPNTARASLATSDRTATVSRSNHPLDRGQSVRVAGGRPSLPRVWTGKAIGVHAYEAVFTGVINARNQTTHFKFQYGLTMSYGQTTEVSEEVVTGSRNSKVASGLCCLRPRTTYHFRIIAFDRHRVIRGRDRTFTTLRTHQRLFSEGGL